MLPDAGGADAVNKRIVNYYAKAPEGLSSGVQVAVLRRGDSGTRPDDMPTARLADGSNWRLRRAYADALRELTDARAPSRVFEKIMSWLRSDRRTTGSRCLRNVQMMLGGCGDFVRGLQG